MRVYSADGLILRTYRYGEADRIVVFLTEDRGKKRGVAKNATKSRRRFGAALEPLTRGRVAYVEREHRELVRLDRIEPSYVAEVEPAPTHVLRVLEVREVCVRSLGDTMHTVHVSPAHARIAPLPVRALDHDADPAPLFGPA